MSIVTGVLSSAPVARVLPSGDHLVQYEVTSGSRDPDQPTTTVPVVWFGPSSTKSLGEPGDAVAVLGSARRRFFRVGGSTQSRTEVLAERVYVKPTKRQRLALARAARAVVDQLQPVAVA